MAVPVAPTVTVQQYLNYLRVFWYPNEDDVTEPENDDGGVTVIENVTSWEVERSDDGETGWTQVRDESEETTLNYIDTTANTANTEYFYRVRGVNGEGDGEYSDVVSETTLAVPGNPSEITATVAFDDLEVAWTLADTAETTIELERSTNGSDYSSLVDLTHGTRTYLDTSVAADTAYWYRVRATNAAGNSSYATVAGSTTSAASVPNAVTDLATEPLASGGVRLTWTNNEVADNEGFTLERSDDYGRTWTTVDDTISSAVETIDDDTTTEGNLYWYRIFVRGELINSRVTPPAFAIGGGPQLAVDGYTPNPPRRFAANPAGATSIALSWADCSAVERGYQVRYRVRPGGAWSNWITYAENSTSATVSNLTSNTPYRFELQALGSPQNSASVFVDASTSANGGSTPTAPSGLTLTGSRSLGSALRAEWTDNSNDENGFVLEYWNAIDPSTRLQETLNANTTSFIISDDPITRRALTPGQTYFARVLAFNAGGNSAWSNIAQGTVYTPPATSSTPADWRYDSVTENGATFRWRDTNPAGATSQFRIWRTLDESLPFRIVATVSGSASSWTETNLSPATNAFYQMDAVVVTTSGETAVSERTGTLAIRTSSGQPQVPDAPTNVVANEIAPGIAEVLWDYPTEQTTHAGFRVYRSSTSGSGYSQVGNDLSPASRTYDDATATAGLTFYYIVRAFNVAGESADSNEAEVTMTAAGELAPDAPTDLVATLVGDNSAALRWTDNSDDESNFSIERSTTGGGVGFSEIESTEPNVTTYLDVDLAASTTYYYRVRAEGPGGNSAYTDEASITTTGDAPAIPTAVEMELVATGPNTVQVNWASTSGLPETYQIKRGTVPETLVEIATPAAGTSTYPDSGLTENTPYYYQVNAINSAGTGTGEVGSVVTHRETGPGRGPRGAIETFKRNFSADSESQTLLTAATDMWVVSIIAITSDVSDGPFATFKVEGSVVATFPAAGPLYAAPIHLSAGDTLTVEFSGTGTGVGCYALTTLVP